MKLSIKALAAIATVAMVHAAPGAQAASPSLGLSLNAPLKAQAAISNGQYSADVEVVKFKKGYRGHRSFGHKRFKGHHGFKKHGFKGHGFKKHKFKGYAYKKGFYGHGFKKSFHGGKFYF